MAIQRFEDIEGWKLGRKLSQFIYRATRSGEFSKDYGLKDQIRRASGSIMHNIAEGFDGGSDAEFTKFLRYAQRSCSEVQRELSASDLTKNALGGKSGKKLGSLRSEIKANSTSHWINPTSTKMSSPKPMNYRIMHGLKLEA